MKLLHRCFAGAAVCALGIMASLTAHAEKVRVAAWNIADFHHEAGIEARPGIGTKRSNGNFRALSKYADRVAPDIIALQEIATPEAVDLVFSSDAYELAMSGRYDPTTGGDIYTAIAWKRDSAARWLETEDVSSIQITYEDDGETRTTRRGTAAKFEVDGNAFWVLSVHLKSSCSSTKRIDRSSSTDCQVLWQQAAPLREWIDSKRAIGEPVIVAGDFNRRFRALEGEDPFWTKISESPEGEDILVRYADRVDRLCPTRKGSSNEPIDWILVDQSLDERVDDGSFWETRWSRWDSFRHGRRLSDHCPIHVELEF